MNLPPAVTLAGIDEAARIVDPVFRDSPQFVSEPISARLGAATVLKVETANPIRSFKGRGSDYLLHRLRELGAEAGELVCASAGNFGQGMAYAARKRGGRLTVFAAESANPLKVERMRALGATVELEGGDFDAAKAAAQKHAEKTGALYLEDGLLGPIAEGAGTIAVELARLPDTLDAVFVPLGNGSLVNGIGAWLKHVSPATRVIAVVAAGAPAMEISWREGRPVSTDTIATIADGIAVRVPVPEALEIMRRTVDEVMLVDDQEILVAMRMLLSDAGLVVEPAGAAGLAGIVQRRAELAGARVATPLCGGNVSEDQFARWFQAGA
jgi:threonine dehydratase